MIAITMDKEDIIPWDWSRILMAEVPPAFLLEAVLRVGFIYVLLLMSMRILGKKMASQFTRNEMGALVCLAAAVGVPILDPARGILAALVISVTIVSLSRLVIYLSVRSQKVESFALGSLETLINNGVMDLKKMESTGLSKERVFSQLRAEQIIHLGEVSRLYFEANGKFTLVKSQDHRPGLVVLPDEDGEFIASLSKTYSLVCNTCGQLNTTSNKNLKCPSCGDKHWRIAVTSAEKSPEEVAEVPQ